MSASRDFNPHARPRTTVGRIRLGAALAILTVSAIVAPGFASAEEVRAAVAPVDETALPLADAVRQDDREQVPVLLYPELLNQHPHDDDPTDGFARN